MNAVFLIGRIIFGGFFLVNGINHFTMMSMMATYSEAKGVPAAGPAVVVTGLLLIFGGLSVDEKDSTTVKPRNVLGVSGGRRLLAISHALGAASAIRRIELKSCAN